LVGYSPQAYYKESKASDEDQHLDNLIVVVVREIRTSHPKIGARKLRHMVSQELSMHIGRDRIFRVLREADMLVKRKRRTAHTTDSRHGFRTYTNLVKDIEINHVDQVWVSDITYIRVGAEFMYLSLITDACSRMVVGYQLHPTLSADGCMKALRMALRNRRRMMDPIHHSDRGLQYCCKNYINKLKSYNLKISMTEIDHCYENAMAERVNGILKHEYGLYETFSNASKALKAVRQAVRLYNEKRPHMALNYRTPSEVYLKSA